VATPALTTVGARPEVKVEVAAAEVPAEADLPKAQALAEPTPQPPQMPAQASAAAPPPVQMAQAPAAAQQAPAATGTIPAPRAAAAASHSCPGNPNALGVSRTVEIDTTGAPGFGFEHFKMYDFLQPGEVVLTFDDGPWPRNTPMVLAALANHCTKATFFSIGKHASYHPEILKQVAAAGHTIGSHTWSHADLSKKTTEQGIDEIEHGISAVQIALGNAPEASFMRFPALRHPPELIAYLAKRNIAMFSTDMDSFDFKMRKPEQVVKSVMDKLKKHGKGIVLMHDFQQATAHGAQALLDQLKAGGYKVVHMRSKAPVTTLPKYNEIAQKDFGIGGASSKPTSSVVRTISE
jgi:peptidoglycan/xylan/chitin deacetylase (PgdA/CDA1 family)